MSLNVNWIKTIFALALWVLGAQGAYADPQTHIEGLRVWASEEKTRIVFELSDPVEYHTFLLETPHRAVIDLKQTAFKLKALPRFPSDGGIKQLRHSLRKKGEQLRVVLDLKHRVKLNSFVLAPKFPYGHRLVIELIVPEKEAVLALFRDDDPPLPQKLHKRNFMVAIDAGHGGEDPGAIGRKYQTKEKVVVLQVARRLKHLIDHTPNMSAFLVRKGDYYVKLRKRIAIAREKGADVFVSIHADSFKNLRARGASVFVLSEKGASSEAARWLAEKENQADLIGGVRLEDKSDLLAKVLLDLSQTATLGLSEELAANVLHQLKTVAPLHHRTVQSAGFAVLKSPDIPSILVELGFISHRLEEKQLLDKQHQQALAKALLAGLKKYFKDKPLPIDNPATTWMVTQKHQVKQGETLSGIALKYKTTVKKIKDMNQLDKDNLGVGQMLQIPPMS